MYHTPGGIYALMITPLISSSTLFRTDIDTIITFNILYDLKVAYRNSSKKGCIQEQQQEMLAQASILVFTTGLPGRSPITQFPALPNEQDTGCRA
jgi:hypothetical protein